MIDSLSHHCIAATSLPALFREQADRLGPRVAVRVKRHGLFIDVSWREWVRRVEDVSRGLGALGVRPGDRVALVSENRLEWLIADLAIQSAGAITVPLHAPLAAAAVRAILADCGAALAIVSSAGQAAKIAPGVPVVQMDGDSPSSWQRVEAMGRAFRDEGAGGSSLPLGREGLGADRGDAVATLVYTSGTSGQPKGVMLSHDNLLANVRGYIDAMGAYPADSVFFLWLPLSHIYARTVDFFLALATGATLALAESAETAAADVALVQPTNISGVPRFYEKLLASVRSLEPADRIRRIRAIFGPNIRWLNSGGASLAPGVAEAYAEAGLTVLVGYGLTEFSPVITTNRPAANRPGTVGQSLPNVEVKISDDGEVLARGTSRMRGYWNQPAATAEAFDGDWLRTGDLGRLDDDGFLTITGRKKELIVLSSGKKVSPMPHEGLLLASPLIEQVVILGEGRPYLTAVIVPRPDALRREVEARGARWPTDWTTNPEVIAVLSDHLRALQTDAAPWERIRKFVMTDSAFSVASEEMTVSSKVRRNAVATNYRDAVESLYEMPENGLPVGAFRGPTPPQL